MGRYALASRMRLPGPQVFACRLQSISTQQLVASAPVPGQEGEAITVNFEPFGTLRGSVARLIDGGFSMEIVGGAEDGERLARKIDWYKRRTFAGVTDKRRHRRFMPREPRSAVVLHSGAVLPCLVIDRSSSGAAVSAASISTSRYVPSAPFPSRTVVHRPVDRNPDLLRKSTARAGFPVRGTAIP